MKLWQPFLHAPALLDARSGCADAAPKELAGGSPALLQADMESLLGADKVHARALDLVRYASDYSPYRLIPKVVVNPQTPQEIAAVLGYARERGHTVTFRAAGTSPNGQAAGDDILVDVRRGWAGTIVEDQGQRVRVRPGTILAMANANLARRGTRLGPDPASAHACTVGGVIANNSSGFAAGVAQTASATLRSVTVVLPSGTILDTGADDAEEVLAATEPELAAGLLRIKAEIEADTELADRIRGKFAIKNASGYRLDGFLIGATPAQILTRLMVCSQGTLGFVAEAVFDTVPLLPARADAFLLFDTLAHAAEAVPKFTAAGAQVAELLDGRTLRACAQLPAANPAWAELHSGSAALLVEVRATDEAALDAALPVMESVLAECVLTEPGHFTRDRAQIGRYWQIREALGGLVGMQRPVGATMIGEDVCVPPARVAEAAKDLAALLDTHGYDPSLQGHASAGNFHFCLMADFATDEGKNNYAKFMDELVELITGRYDGSLKAEHGSGRNMAPFVPIEWGDKATDLMWRIKQLFDPHGVLAPDVMLTRNPTSHLQHLQSMPQVEDTIEHCIECGFCEHVCPSRHLTTTPRQRIVVRREIARQGGDTPLRRTLLEQYEYDAVETCAGDGSCSIACPVDIDTGTMMKALRHTEHTAREEKAWLLAARRWGLIERLARVAVRGGHLLGATVMTVITGLLRRVVSTELMPGWLREMPAAAPARLPRTERDGAAAVYFPACINRIFGRGQQDRRDLSLPEALVALSARAGLPLWIPDDVRGSCCATVWHSKGYHDGNTYMANLIIENLWRWSDSGTLPVVIDAASCTLGVLDEITDYLTTENAAHRAAMTIMDATTWTQHKLLPKLTVGAKLGRVAMHPTCSTRHLGIDGTLAEIAAALATEVVVPQQATCCAFAGDRGFLHPELTEAATRDEADELADQNFDAYLCNNRTCEIGLEHGIGGHYESFVFTLERQTRPPGVSTR
ncbi:FAD-binding and (Fe-S)-binding domain-containing protein [Nocardia pseudobrasiliensis]|uniref:D-lactate dehydrogenase (cytochrome) n=1 Tax=Nocardia pseudobrasiliensis TaxID=45979 RepID=A0A370ICF2_9NOCA|nr:FAD-binding and (Fe-S)-binding domain-containing protein [Nocardia pseudobrasiliensis]RDI68418.1 D-lactate dehydrogenase [Nocardia pseudobrasiliensis]